MTKTSFAAVLAGLFLGACGGEVDDQVVPPPAPGAAVSEPKTPPAAPPVIPESSAGPPPATDAWVAPTMDPTAVKAYCASDASKRPVRGSFDTLPNVDVTATIEAVTPTPNSAKARAVLTLRVDFPDERKESKESGPQLIESWNFTHLEIDSAAGKDAFAVGTHDGAAITGSAGNNSCDANGGQGASGAWDGGELVKVVITKRTAEIIEGTFDGKAFSAVLAEPFKPLACCL